MIIYLWCVQEMWRDIFFVLQVSMSYWIVKKTIIQEKGAKEYSEWWLNLWYS